MGNYFLICASLSPTFMPVFLAPSSFCLFLSPCARVCVCVCYGAPRHCLGIKMSSRLFCSYLLWLGISFYFAHIHTHRHTRTLLLSRFFAVYYVQSLRFVGLFTLLFLTTTTLSLSFSPVFLTLVGCATISTYTRFNLFGHKNGAISQ